MNQQERQELVKYRITKARETFNEVDLHVENKLWNTAVNRLYYACYYAVIALLIDKDIQAQTHSGVRQMFGLQKSKYYYQKNKLCQHLSSKPQFFQWYPYPFMVRKNDPQYS